MFETQTILGWRYPIVNFKGVAEIVERAAMRHRGEILPFKERGTHCLKWTNIN